MSLSWALHGGTSLAYYFFMWKQQKKGKKVEKRKNWKGVKAEAERHPLIMAVRAYCMWGKGSDWGGGKSLEVRAGVTEWKQWQLWWGLLDVASVLSQQGQRWSCGRGQKSLLWRHWSNAVFRIAMSYKERTNTDIAFGLSFRKEGKERKGNARQQKGLCMTMFL